MKGKYLAISFIFLTQYAIAQTNTFPSSGNVGIGTTSPSAPLQVSANNVVYGNIMALVSPGTYSNGNSTGHGFGLISNTSFANQGAISQIGLVQTTPNVNDIAAGVYLKIGGWYQNSGTSLPIALGGGFLSISPSIYIAAGSGVGGGNVGIGTTNTQGDKFQVATGGQYFRSGTWGIGIADAGWRNTLILSNNYTYHEIYSNTGSPLVFQNTDGGNVLIGKTSQTNTSYRLDVNGNIRSNAVVVNTTGADFVFDSTYQLPSLSQVEDYIRQNKHLSEVPSSKEMRANGVNLGENQMKLLQKVEELTLYVIAQNKQLSAQKKKIAQLELKDTEISGLNLKVNLLEQKLNQLLSNK